MSFLQDFNTIAVVKIRVSFDPANVASGPVYAVNFIYDANNNGIADALEAALGDANGDGQPDVSQTGVATFVAPPTAGIAGNGSGAGVMSIIVGDRNPSDPRADRNGVVVDPQGTVKNVTAVPVSEFSSVPETWTPVSPVIQFEIANAVLQPDGSVVIVIALPAGATPPKHVYKFGYEFPTSTEKTFFQFDWDGRTGGELIDTNHDGKPDAVRMVYRDGERGDDDLLVNGIIVDPIALGTDLDITPKPVFTTPAGIYLGVSPALTGTAQGLATVKIYDGTGLLGTTVATAGGGWTFTPPSALSEGAHTFSATATLPPAQTSDPAVLLLELDASGPTAPVFLNSSVGASSTVLRGTAEGGATVIVYMAGSELGRTVALPTGSWSLSAALGYGIYNLTARAADAVGNLSPATGPFVVSVPAPVAVRTVSITLGGLNQTFDGKPKPVTVVTNPTGVAVAVTYAGSTSVPAAAGVYPVMADVTTAGYTGRATGNLTITAPPAPNPVSSQTIAFALPAKGTAGASLTLAATASSGLPVSFTLVSGPARLSGAVLTLLDVGTVVVRASQGGNTAFQAAALERTLQAVAPIQQIYLGEVTGAGGGNIALSVPPSGTSATLLLVLPASGVQGAFPLVPDAAGNIAVELPLPVQAGVTGESVRPVAAAAATALLRGVVRDERFSGTIEPLGLSFNVALSPATGTTAALAGFYRADMLGVGGGSVYSMVGFQGQALVLVSTPDFTVGTLAAVDATLGFLATITTPTGPTVLRGVVDSGNGTITGGIRLANGVENEFAGLREQLTPLRRLINLSSRTRVGSGEQTLISGFVVGGTSPQTVLIRGIGPALQNFGLEGALASPRLRLFRDGTVVAENSGWSKSGTAPAEFSAAFARLGAFALPENSADAALLVTLPPGAYTLHVDGGDGVALAEIYDAAAAGSSARLLNVSSRGVVGAGADALIGGFVVAGNTPQRVLVRAVGPALQGFGVQGALADPRLSVYRGSTVVAENDNWGGADVAALVAAQQAVGAFPLPAGSKDAVLYLTLAPGAYTAQVTGVGAGTGVALVEIYQIP